MWRLWCHPLIEPCLDLPHTARHEICYIQKIRINNERTVSRTQKWGSRLRILLILSSKHHYRNNFRIHKCFFITAVITWRWMPQQPFQECCFARIIQSFDIEEKKQYVINFIISSHFTKILQYIILLQNTICEAT